MRRPLPPLTALRAFEAAARHLSFKAAAAELNVTPAAVSHQVKALEAHLQQPLFHRLTRALRLTRAGKAALPALSEGFDRLAEGAAQLRAARDSTVLTVSVSPGFGSMWLVPRLDRFYRAHPGIEIRLDGTDRLVDVAGGACDVAIRYGPGGYGGVCVAHLFTQSNIPVCSPALLRGENALRRPEDLSRHTLLHIDWKEAEASWRMWLRAAGLPQIDPTRGPHFSQETMAVRAALDGHGVALVGDRLIEDHLVTGALVCPFDPTLRTPLTFSYYLLTPREDHAQPRVEAFCTWLVAEARASGPDTRR